ncbi:MAG TPA: DUF2270 domain-containing protein [Longimicrobiales bacterium]|nr:DUF2270 domain-containing protein [Longimicrobiales bacterium]
MTAIRPDQTLVHFYRAVVAHMDVWRQRMDATTNWAAATGAGMITFAFSTPDTPHFVLLLAIVFQSVFLIMESRRYQTYDLWRRRFRTMNRHMIAPVLRGEDDLDEEGRGRLAELALDLGRTVPHLGVADAIGYRLRRNYGYLLAVTLVAWTLKLETQPEAAPTVAALLERARVGLLPGESVVGGVFLFAVGVVILVLRAPSEQMLGWNEVPAPFLRWNWSGRDRLKGDPGPS